MQYKRNKIHEIKNSDQEFLQIKQHNYLIW